MATSDVTNTGMESTEEQGKLATTKPASNGATGKSTARKLNGKDSQAIELYQPAPLPSNRPVAASGLEIVRSGHTFQGYRPISSAHLTIIDTDTLPNHRPIVKSGLEIVNSDSLPQHRPIVRSKFPLPNSNVLPNHRPIASNQIDNPLELMGFLD
ncbi:MAG TPA: hypothetical protein V6D19_16660 [Stenomitos sp.]